MNSSTDPQPTPYYFLSYSRQEVTFVDSLARELEKHGIRTWVDFRNLIPGHKWQHQLDEGLNNSEAILLVISKASMKSRPVMDELKKSVDSGKRIVMIIFEPCFVDRRLNEREWVDFSRDFDGAILQLKSLLAQPEGKMLTTPPQKYVREKAKSSLIRLLLSPLLFIVSLLLRIMFGSGYLPKGTKRFFFLSMLATGLSFLSTAGTSLSIENEIATNILIFVLVAAIVFVYIPAAWNFIQFLVRIRFRTHNAEKLRNAIFGLFGITVLPLLISIGAFLGIPGVTADSWAFWPALITLSICYYVYRILTSEAFYRWAGPSGVLIAPTRPDLTKHLNADQGDTKVAIEFAPQDRAYARELKDSVMKAGFKYTDNVQEANIVLTLLSAYQNRSRCDPENKYVFPILLQSSRDIEDGDQNEFTQIQWIDLRFGKASMNAVAHLLDEPDNLLRVLGMVPVRTPILPNGVSRMIGVMSFIITYSAIFTLVQVILKLSPDSTGVAPGLAMADYLAILCVVGMYLFRRIIVKRRFWLVKKRLQIFYRTAISDPLMSKIIPILEQRKMFLSFEEKLNQRLGRVGFSFPWVLGFALVLALLATFTWGDWMFALPVWLIPPMMLLKEIRLWLPARAK